MRTRNLLSDMMLYIATVIHRLRMMLRKIIILRRRGEKEKLSLTAMKKLQNS